MNPVLACMCYTHLEKCLAVLYDAHVHLPAFHALKAWGLAVMASSPSKNYSNVSLPWKMGKVTETPTFSCGTLTFCQMGVLKSL